MNTSRICDLSMVITKASDMFAIAEYQRRRRKAGAPLYQGLNGVKILGIRILMLV